MRRNIMPVIAGGITSVRVRRPRSNPKPGSSESKQQRDDHSQHDLDRKQHEEIGEGHGQRFPETRIVDQGAPVLRTHVDQIGA